MIVVRVRRSEANSTPIRLEGVRFHTGSAKLIDDSLAKLDRVANVLKKYPDLLLEVAGHTDDQGDEALNIDLSQRRAEAVRIYLIEVGALAENLTAKGYGESVPVADNGSETGRAINRRVELNPMD